MDFYMIASIIIMLAVVTVLIAAVWIYQKGRQRTGYHTGKFFNIHQFMGALIGDYHLNQIGDQELNHAPKPDPNEEVYTFPEAEKR